MIRDLILTVVAITAAGLGNGSRVVAQGPASTATPLPFPLYGTPASSAVTKRPVPGVGATVSLQQAIAIAAASSPALAAARSTYHIAQAEVLVAREPQEPSLSLRGQLYSQSDSGNSRSAGVALSQLIYDGGRTISQIQAAKGVSTAAADAYRRSLETLAFNVAQSFYLDLLARAQVRLQLEIVHQDLIQERLIAAQIEAGTAANVDLKTAEVPTAQARVAVVKAQGAALSADATFAVTLGLHADSYISPSDEDLDTSILPPDATLDYARALPRALALRPDFLAASSTLASAEASLRAARLSGEPALELNAFGGEASVEGTSSQPQSSANLSATLTVPLYDQGTRVANVALANGQVEQAAAALDSMKLSIELDVRQALINLVSGQAAYGQTQDELAKATDVLGATQEQYRAGQTTLPLLLNAQTQFAQAETDTLSARSALRQAEQAYLYALGENDPH